MSSPKTLPCQPGELTAGESVLLPVLLKMTSSLDAGAHHHPGCVPLSPLPAGLVIFSLVPTTLGVGVALVNACKGNEAVAILLTVGTNILVRACGRDEA